MKKSLLALAVFGAFATTASAEVTLYGTLDANYGVFKKETTEAGVKEETENTGLRDGDAVIAPSRWGIKASSDLGNGLKGIAHVESAVNLMDGSTDDNLFQRKAVVGVAGSFGTVLLGRFDNPIHKIADEGSAFGTDTVATYSSGITGSDGTRVGYSSRAANSINYISPNFGGFSANLQLVNEKTEETGEADVETEGFAAGVVYENGPMLVGVGYDRRETGSTNPENTAWVLSTAYDLGVAKIMANYAQFDRDEAGAGVDAEANQFNIGASTKMGAFTLIGQVGRNKFERGTLDQDGTDYVFGVHYHLAKKTFAYVRAGKYGHLEGNAFETENTAYAVGLRHAF